MFKLRKLAFPRISYSIPAEVQPRSVLLTLVSNLWFFLETRSHSVDLDGLKLAV